MSTSILAAEWNINPHGLNLITSDGQTRDSNIILKNALDADLKEIGLPVLTKELTKNLISKLVLQIQKIRNIAAPKSNEESQAAPRMLKLVLTDGEAYVQAIETSPIPSISRDKTAPGSKILVYNANILNGFLMLNQSNCKLLGGKVSQLYEKWELAKSVQKHSRQTTLSDGPPAWVNFGCKISAPSEDGKSMDNKIKNVNRDNSEFDTLRQGAIAEANTGAVKKVFGGGVKQSVNQQNSYRKNEDNKNMRDSGRMSFKNKKEIRKEEFDEKPQKPSERVSLFDFLENKLPVNEAPSDKSNKIINFPQKTPGQQFNEPRKEHYVKNDLRYPNNQKGNYREGKNSTKRDPNNWYRDEEYSSGTHNFPVHNWGSKDNSAKKAYEKTEIDKNGTPRNQINTNFKERNSYNKNWNMNARDNYNSQEKPYNNNRDSTNYSRHQNNQVRNDSYESHHPQKFSQPCGQLYNDEMRNFPNISPNQDNYRENNYKIPEKPKEHPKRYYQQEQQSNSCVKENAAEPIDGLVNNMSRMSVNSQFASRSLKQHLNLNSLQKTMDKSNINSSTPQKWNIGDSCLAKYWEDGKYYTAIITGLTDMTYVVKFRGYGNIEEVLKEDCLPTTRNNLNEDNVNSHKGPMEFRRTTKKFTNS